MGLLTSLGKFFPNLSAPSNNVLSGGGFDNTPATGITTYSGSDVSNSTADFLGDWRSADSWQRFDIWRVRNRSRQLANGNPWLQGYLRNMCNNVLGHKGFHFKPQVKSGRVYGDSNDGIQDDFANAIIRANYDEQGKKDNLTTRKQLSRRDLDGLLLRKLIIDGEFILRKIKQFPNDFNFAWQVIDPDYLDHNLNRIEANGNLTKMGIEYDAEWKFPVAYWFLHRRPNDNFYNYQDLNQQRYIRVPADEVIHVYVRSIDPEQSRGWPWIFAALINLFRIGKYEEAALLNAAIGAAKMGFFKKTVPEGWEGDPSELDDNGRIVDEVSPGTWTELPYGVEPVPWTPTYPEQQFGEFEKSMLLGTAMTFGTSYATTTGDMSQANFVSSRMGQIEEREHYMQVQEFFVEQWKEPGFDEELYRAIMAQKVKLPLAKFKKFIQCKFTGRRWAFVQPVDDMRAKEIAMNNCLTSPGMVIEETTQEDAEEVFQRIAADNALMKKYGLERIIPNQPMQEQVPTEKKPEPAKKV